MLKIYDDSDSPCKGGGVFKIYDEPDSPSKGGVFKIYDDSGIAN